MSGHHGRGKTALPREAGPEDPEDTVTGEAQPR